MGWKTKTLNQAGRVTLASAILTTIPTYTMQNLWLSEGICENIDKSIRSFIWGKSLSHWVSWNQMTQPKTRGGLGICQSR